MTRDGWTAPEAAAAFGVSDRTVRKCLARFRTERRAGLAARSTRPARSPRQTARALERRIATRRARRETDDFRGSLSPNGRELVYHSWATGVRNIYLLKLGDRRAPRQLTHARGQQLTMANWSPDGSALCLFDLRHAIVLVMRRDRRGTWSAPRAVARDAWRPEWSPDGRTFALVSPLDGRIGLVSADSGGRRDLYVPGASDPLAELAVFAPSGRELYFETHDASGRASFGSIATSGGRPRLLVRFDDPARSSNRFDFASDGKRFYFTLEDRESDLWVAEVVRR